MDSKVVAKIAPMDIDINSEKASTSPLEFVVHRGVMLKSRRRKKNEFDTMKKAVDRVFHTCWRWCKAVNEISCDSGADAYLVSLDGTNINNTETNRITYVIRDAIVLAEGYHNGILVRRNGREVIGVDPEALRMPQFEDEMVPEVGGEAS